MGVYAVTGGSHGIGAKTVELLKKEGHEVINIDLLKGDITADLVTLEGRQKVIDELHAMHPEGLDGLHLKCCRVRCLRKSHQDHFLKLFRRSLCDQGHL